MCQLLLANGADVHARDWDSSETPLGYACSTGRFGVTSRGSATNNLEDIVRLLLESGLDTQTSVEVDRCLDDLDFSYHILNLETLARTLSWLLQRYIQTITCDGMLACPRLQWKVCRAIEATGRYHARFANDISCNRNGKNGPLTLKNVQALHFFWLYLLDWATELATFAWHWVLHFCQTYAGDFHYRQLCDSMCRGDIEISPMESALRSFHALGTFHHILLTSKTDIITFVRKECTMPWCNYASETLMNFFSLSLEGYTMYETLFQEGLYCRNCNEYFHDEDGRFNWQKTIELVERGRSLASILDTFLSSSDKEVEGFIRPKEICEQCS